MILFFKAKKPSIADADAAKSVLRAKKADLKVEKQAKKKVDNRAKKNAPKDLSTTQVLEENQQLAYIIALQTASKQAEVGEHLGFEPISDTAGTHYFKANLAGYEGWRWAVTLSILNDEKKPSILESALVPGNDALLAPKWVPFKDRLKPSDISDTDELPYEADDDRLEVFTKLSKTDADALENLALERNRVLSAYGKSDLAARWYEGAHGPYTASTRIATANCMTCAFYIPLAGDLGQLFGACANSWSRDDGRVVSTDHGCGLHSETDSKSSKRWKPADSVIDQLDNVDLIDNEIEDAKAQKSAENITENADTDENQA